MSITDELRAWAKGSTLSSWTAEHLTAIADRIDVEYQKAIRELNGLAEDSVLLPKDADGEYIHVGDRLDGYGKTIEVVEFRYGRSGWVLISRDGNGYADTFAFTHHAQTVEDVLCDLLNEYRENECTLEEARLSEYAKRLRLVNDEE